MCFEIFFQKVFFSFGAFTCKVKIFLFRRNEQIFFFRNKLFALDVSDANEMKSFIDLLNDVKQRHFELYFVYRTL